MNDTVRAKMLELIRFKLKADGVAEDDDDAVRECLGRTVSSEKLTAIWFEERGRVPG